jgi:coatomer subunit beta'
VTLVFCRVAKFLEARGHVEKALEIAQDADYRFELAVQLDKVDVAVSIAEQLGSETRWKQLGEMALADGRLELAERCLGQAGDVSGMLLMHSATGNHEGMKVWHFSALNHVRHARECDHSPGSGAAAYPEPVAPVRVTL